MNRFVALCLAIAACLPVASFGQDFASRDRAHLEKIKKPSPVDDAVDRGIAWLIQQQDPTTGAFAGKHANAYTGLACIALMASGHFPERSRYGTNLRSGLMYLADQVKREKNGYLGNDGGRMYGHGICTLAMTEAYGMMANEVDNRTLRDALAPSLRLILNAQVHKDGEHFGGWRYNPNATDSDLSVAAWQILALRSAQNCQLPIPQQAIDDALKYVHSTYVADKHGFGYQRDNNHGSAMRSAGVVCMRALGANVKDDDRKLIEDSAKVLLEQNPMEGGYFYYRCYYLATAANMVGGEHFTTLMPKLENTLLKLQKPDGQFEKQGGYDDGVYSTSFAIICLAVNYQYLPIYQE